MNNEQSISELQQELQVLLEEYKDVRNEIGRRILSQTNVIIYGVPAILTVAATYFSFVGEGTVMQNYPRVLVVINFISFYLGMFIILQDEMILTLAGYQEKILKPRLSDICKGNVLLWHDYLQANRHEKGHPLLWRLSKILVSPFSVSIYLIMCLMSLLVQLYLHFYYSRMPLTAEHKIFLVISTFTLVYFAISLVLTGIKYNKDSFLSYDR